MCCMSICVLYLCRIYVCFTTYVLHLFEVEAIYRYGIKHWKISDFAKKLGKHNNTIDGWFRDLEIERRLHYVSRVNGEKVYDELDFKIAKFIIKCRDHKWSLDAIYDDLSNHFELRPFPETFEPETKEVQVVDIDKVKSTLMNEMKTTFMELAATQVQEQMKEMQNLLPSREEERLDRINAIMAERKVTRMLEEEAIDLWEKKPEEERIIKIGWFRKKGDRKKVKIKK